MIVNGDFEGGSAVGFQIPGPYTMLSSPYSGSSTTGDYAIAANPQPINTAYFITGTDHTSGTGNMLIVDATTVSGQKRFYKTGTGGAGACGLTTGLTYEFSYWIKSVATTVTNWATRAEIGLQITNSSGVILLNGSPYAPLPIDEWKYVSYKFVATAPCVNVEMWNFNLGAVGNDFAMDDIALRLYVACAAPPTTTITQPNCVTPSATLTVTSPLGPNYQYSINGVTYQSSPTFATVAPGNYNVTYNDTALGCTSPINVITINPIPTAPVPPAVTTPVYYCQNDTAAPLSATASPGSTLRWYGTNASGGTSSGIPTVPSTATLGNTTYYVSQWNGLCESARAAVVVRVVANTGASVNVFCDGANTTATSVAFDWSNVPGYLGYNYSYSINGGPLVFGSQVSPSHFDVPVTTPGAQVVFTIINVIGVPCSPSETVACISDCITTQTPNFAAISPICSGSPVPTLANTSPNGITGTWLPATINNTIPGSYIFTPNITCASTQTLSVTILPKPTPTFLPFAPLCQNATPPVLPMNSTNSPPISGTWNNTVSTASPGTTVYTFTPNAGQCVTGPVSINIVVNPTRIPNFPAVPPFCSGTAAPALANVSPNGITGTWNPSIVSNTSSNSYIFTPNAGQCAVPQTLTITVIPSTTPNFPPIPTICSGSPVPLLANTSPNGVSGTWAPATINNLVSGSYVFTPNVPCASTQTLNVTIRQRLTPNFPPLADRCQFSTPPLLPSISSNSITGTWNVPTTSTSVVGISTYTFTPDPGQCVTPGTVSVTLEVLPNITPTFNPIASFCSGSPAPALPLTSTNGVTGTWSPAAISNTTSGTYLFTPAANQCAVPQSLSVNVIQQTVPTFTPIAPFCAGVTAPSLPAVSLNGVLGTWSPATINNAVSDTYLFTPNAGECATTRTLLVTILDPITPDFVDFELCLDTSAPSLNFTSANGITGTWLPATVDTSVGGVFPFVFTPDAGECAVATTIEVTINTPTLVAINATVSNAFSDNPTITVIAVNGGEYLYQLDFGPFQESPLFENVAYGVHTATVVDRNGCSPPITVEDILVVDYPKFFTPNGDGFNDTWNVFGIEETFGTKIFIFDRYGKLLKQISPDGNGWDGTYNGNQMPATDYWFSINYNELAVKKQFKAHFSLKR